MDGLFCDDGIPIYPVTFGEIEAPISYAVLSTNDRTTDTLDTDNYERYTDIGYIGYSLEPLSLGAALGFGLITIFVLITYGVSKAISLVRIKNQ